MTDINPVLFPLDTPTAIVEGFKPVHLWDDMALLSCNICGQDLGVHFDEHGVVKTGYIQALAAHLFCQHHIMHLAKCARGE